MPLMWNDASEAEKEAVISRMLTQVSNMETKCDLAITQQFEHLKHIGTVGEASQDFAEKQVDSLVTREQRSKAQRTRLALGVLRVALGIVGAAGAVDALADSIAPAPGHATATSNLMREKLSGLQHQASSSMPASGLKPSKGRVDAQGVEDEIKAELAELQQKSSNYMGDTQRQVRQAIKHHLGSKDAVRALIEAQLKDSGDPEGGNTELAAVEVAVSSSLREIEEQFQTYYDAKTERLSKLTSALQSPSGRALLDRYTQRKAVIALAESRFSEGKISRELGFRLSLLFPEQVFQRKRAFIRILNKLGMTITFRGEKGQEPRVYFEALRDMSDDAHVLPAYFGLKTEDKQQLISSLGEVDEQLTEHFLEDLECIANGQSPKHDPDKFATIPTSDNPQPKQQGPNRKGHYMVRADENTLAGAIADKGGARMRAKSNAQARKAATSRVLQSLAETDPDSVSQIVADWEAACGKTLDLEERKELIAGLRAASDQSFDEDMFDKRKVKEAWQQQHQSTSSLDSGHGPSPEPGAQHGKDVAAANRAKVQASMNMDEFDGFDPVDQDFAEPGHEDELKSVRDLRPGGSGTADP